MSINLLHYFLATELSALFLIFCRIGAAMMVMPGFGETYVPSRIRLLFALLFSLLLTPLMMNKMPPMPANAFPLLLMMGEEITIGLFLGLMVHGLTTVMHVGGNIIASQSSLAVGAIFDPNSGAQSPIISNMMGVTAITLFFVLDLHHLVLAALVQSYEIFSPGHFLPTGDMAHLNIRWMADAFSLGALLAAPHIIFSLLFYLLGGLMTRLMPNFQIFFILIAPQVVIGILIFLAIIPMIFDLYINFFENHLRDFLAMG